MRRAEHGYLSVRETADLLNVAPRTVQNMAGRGRVIRIPVNTQQVAAWQAHSDPPGP